MLSDNWYFFVMFIFEYFIIFIILMYFGLFVNFKLSFVLKDFNFGLKFLM